MNNELARLKELAQRATPGEWQYRPTTPFMDAEIASTYQTRVVNLLAGDVTKANSEFISAAHPAAVIALIERLEAAEAQVKELTADLDKESEIRHRIHEELNAIKGEQKPVAVMYPSGQVITQEECDDDIGFSICCKVNTPLYIHPSSSGADDYHMQRHEFAAMVNELRSLPNIQSKRELIVKTLSAFNISPVAPAPGGDHG